MGSGQGQLLAHCCRCCLQSEHGEQRRDQRLACIELTLLRRVFRKEGSWHFGLQGVDMARPLLADSHLAARSS